MPWTVREVAHKTKKARTAKQKRQWVIVANSVLKRTGDEGRAVREANAAVAKSGHHKKVKRKRH